MRTRRISSILLAGAMMVGGTAAAAAPAAAEDFEAAAPHQRCLWLADDAGLGCFNPQGDVFAAHDTVRDGKRVVTAWQTDYGRTGECHNAKGAFSTHFCDGSDLAEHRKVRFKVSLRDGASGDDEKSTGWSDWLSIG
ncbi:hypothetical protein [Brachybacterium sp. FME24]|uniref:hypothetical protein n=1 Tax=Brachybacterium sp. FME24 TaxID=2742605 RepID=UPI001867A5BA|nr:hypothetical protein [Brachybacterium sp. FME24]